MVVGGVSSLSPSRSSDSIDSLEGYPTGNGREQLHYQVYIGGSLDGNHLYRSFK